MQGYTQPGLIASEHGLALGDRLLSPDDFKANALFRIRQSITFGDYLIYCGTLGILREFETHSPGWEYTLGFEFGTHMGQLVTGSLGAELNRLSDLVSVGSVFERDMMGPVPRTGDLVRLRYEFPLYDNHMTILPAGSSIFLMHVGEYHGPMDFIDVAFFNGGKTHRAVIQACTIGTHMGVVSSINDACSDGRG